MGKQINLSIQKSNGLTLDLKGGSGGGTTNYNALTNKPIINDVTVIGDKTGEDYSLQNKLIAGENIILIDNPDNTTTISSTGGSGSHDYSDLINKPQINNVELEGNKSGEDLRLTLSVQEIEKILYLP